MNNEKIASSPTSRFYRSLPFGSANETETANAHPPNDQSSDLTKFEALQPQPISFSTLTEDLTHLEEAMDTALTAVAELKSDVGLLESRLTDLHRKSLKLLNTELRSLFHNLVALNRRVMKVGNHLSQTQHSLVGQ